MLSGVPFRWSAGSWGVLPLFLARLPRTPPTNYASATCVDSLCCRVEQFRIKKKVPGLAPPRLNPVHLTVVLRAASDPHGPFPCLSKHTDTCIFNGYFTKHKGIMQYACLRISLSSTSNNPDNALCQYIRSMDLIKKQNRTLHHVSWHSIFFP